MAVPQSPDPPDVPQFISRLIGLITDVYSHAKEQLEPLLETADTVLSIRVDDEQTSDGSIEFERFDQMIQQLRNLIVHTTAFVSEEEPIIEQIPAEAQDLLSSSRFLQTARGSFVISLQLPANKIIRNASLLNPETITADAVTQRMLEVLGFIAGEVLERRSELFSETHFREHPQLVNLNVLEDVKELFDTAGNTSLGFSFLSLDGTHNVSSGRLTPERTAALNEYVLFVRDMLTEDLSVDVEGKIVELRSKNPEGNRNYVLVQAVYQDRPTFFALTLDNEKYSIAVQAHRRSKSVRVSGRARKMKTQMKISELVSFTEV